MMKKITNFEFGTLNYFITRALFISVTFNGIINFTKQDSWIIPLLNIILGIIYIFVVNTIMNYEPDLTISEKLKKLFNPIIATIINIACIIYALFLGIINFINLVNFIQSQFLTYTPIIFIAIIFAITSFYVIKKGITTIARTSVILFYISIILLMLSLIGLIPEFNLSNIKPMFTSNTNDYFKALLNFYAFDTALIYILMSIPKNKIKKPNIKKSLLLSFFLSSISLFIIVFSTLTIFGYELSLLYEYPEFHVLKNIAIIGMTSRIESILVMQLLFDIFICHIMIIYFLSTSLSSIKKININYYHLAIITIIVIAIMIFSKYNIYFDSILIHGFPLVSTIFSIFIPILLFIKIKIKNKS